MKGEVVKTATVPVDRYVAVCDVLGFSKLLENHTLEQVAEGYRELVEWAKAASQLRGYTVWPDGTQSAVRVTMLVETAVFSDTIIVWSRDLVDPEPYGGARASNFFHFVGQLILGGLRRTSQGFRLPIRAGIAYGPIIIIPDEQIYVGQPIVEAHRLEQSQEWIGAACHFSCHNAADFKIVICEFAYVSEYSVPMKERRDLKPVGDCRDAPLAVTWPGMIWTLPIGPDDYYMENIKNILQEASLGPKEIAMWSNTLEFGMAFREFRDPEDKEPF